MNRVFSIIRRRPHIVDLVTPFVYGVAGYRIKSALTFDAAAPVTVLTSPNTGFLDDSIDYRVIDSQPMQGRVRIVFNPATYGLDDNVVHWLWLFHVDAVGVETPVSAATLLLPDASLFLSRGQGHIVVTGAAPNAVDVTHALQLDFPRLMTDWRVHNTDGSKSAFIAFEEGGSEYELQAPSAIPQLSTYQATSGSCWVRGSGGAVNLTIAATVANPR